jgi:hypothetical protein
MIELIAIVLPEWISWMGVVSGPLAIVLGGFLFFKLDGRYELKTAAVTKVEELKNVDTEIKEMVEKLAHTVDVHVRTSIANDTTIRAEMSKGFADVTKTINDAAISLTKDVAQMQGRLAGAGGVHLKEN